MPTEPEKSDIFERTRWSLVVGARSNDPLAGKALNELVQSYWRPVYFYLRRQGHEASDAEDLAQEYFSSLLRRNYLNEADQAKGRFRAFLLADLKLFWRNASRKLRTEKRGGAVSVVSLDVEDAESLFEPATKASDAELIFDREWAFELFQSARRSLAAEWEKAGKAEIYQQLAPLLDRHPADGVLAGVAGALNSTPGAVKVMLHRMRGRFAEVLKMMVRETVLDPSQVHDELKHLVNIWAKTDASSP